MKIKSIQPTAKFTAVMGDDQTIMLEVKFLAIDEVWEDGKTSDGIKVSNAFRKSIIHSVVGWDLVDEKNDPIPCDDENRAKYLPIILGMVAKGSKVPLVYEVQEFARDSKNFLKN